MNAELLIMFTLDCDRAYLYAHPERELTDDEIARYDAALARRATGVPAQYITGHQEFWGMDLIVSPAVLIPRPETEHVVEAVLEAASLCGGKARHQDQEINSRGQECPRHTCAWSMLALDRALLRWRWLGNCPLPRFSRLIFPRRRLKWRGPMPLDMS